MRHLRLLTAIASAALAAALPAAANSQIVLTGAAGGIDNAQADQAGARLSILEFKADARITGRMADVTLELLIGTTGRMDEARLSLALPKDAVITGYALDVGGRMIPGQLIEQPKARNVYQDQLRVRVDPGLAEVTAQNVFQTRIYPLSANAPRRIRVQFSAPFDPAKGLVLPLGGDRAIGSSTISVMVDGYAQAPVISLGGTALTAESRDGHWAATSMASNTRLSGSLSVSGGQPSSAMQIMRHANGRNFFVIADSAAANPAASPSGGRLRVYWDRSLSHRESRIADEIEALVTLIESTRPAAIDLVTFASDRPQVTTVTSAAALRTALAEVTYRGGTSLAGLGALRLEEAAQCVLVFDGQVTIDHGAEFETGCPTAVLTAADGADGARLGRMAQHLRGRLLRIEPGRGHEAGLNLSHSALTVTDVQGLGGQRLKWRALAAPENGWLLVGELPQNFSGPLTVRIAGPRGSTARTYSAQGPALRSDAPGALWASQQVAELGDDAAQHDAMVALARDFQVAGPQLAFLVLEAPEQYLRADIAPPQGFSKEWMDRYAAQAAEHNRTRAGAQEQRFNWVLGQWNERRDWWGRKFSPTPPRPVPMPRRNTTSRAPGDEGEDGDLIVTGTAATPAPPMMAPPPPPAPSPRMERREAQAADSDADGNSDNIIVTANRVQESVQDVPVAISTVSSETIGNTSRERAAEPQRPNPPSTQTGTVQPAGNRAITVDLSSLLAGRPYLAALDAAAPRDRLGVLAQQERAYGSIPTFYLDTAEWFRLKGDVATAELLLLSALELDKTDDETRQIVAFRLERDHQLDRAVSLAERFAANASFRPQPGRFLALTLAARGRANGRAGRADLERAFRLLTDAALKLSDVDAGSEFDGIEVVSLMEANALIPAIEAAGGHWTLDRRLVGLTDADARIVIEWTADDADVDLWVDEPGGERVYYGNKLSSAGGQISNDMTDGYGPEEYTIRSAPGGQYQVRINGFDADRLNPNGPGHVLIRLIRNFGRANADEVLVDADLAFQSGPNRNTDAGMRPVAELRVGR
jgi:hypothetical protein